MAARVVVLAQDLIWQDRLARVVQAAGAESVPTGSLDGLDRAVARGGFAVIDLTARAYEPLVAIEHAVAGGVRVLAVGQHDDVAQRKAALARGADRVLAYRKLFEDGPRTIGAWLAGAGADVAATPR